MRSLCPAGLLAALLIALGSPATAEEHTGAVAPHHATDAQSGQQVWSERFDRPLGSFFANAPRLDNRVHCFAALDARNRLSAVERLVR